MWDHLCINRLTLSSSKTCISQSKMLVTMIVFVVWLSDERHLALFPAGTIVRDTDHLESLSSRIWTCAELEVRLCWMKLSSSTPLHHHTTNHYSMVSQQWSMYILTCFESNLGLFAGLKAVSLSVFCSLSSLL